MWTSKRWIVILAAVSMVTVGVPGMGNSLAGPAHTQTTGTDQAPPRPMDVDPAAVDEDDEWRQWRADSRHTATLDATADLANPAVIWKHNIGGFVCCDKVELADLDDDGEEEAVLAIALNAVARDPDTGETLWTTGIRGIQGVIGVHDLDQDGAPDVVATTGTQILVLDVATGETLSAMDQHQYSRASNVIIDDLDPDTPGLELALVDSDHNLTVYGFQDGTESATKLWSTDLTSHQPQHGRLALGELGGELRLVYNLWPVHELRVYDAGNGSFVGNSVYSHTFLRHGPITILTDTDGDGTDEAVLWHDSKKWAAAFKWDEQAATFQVLWSTSLPSTLDDADQVDFRGIEDLDADGIQEMVVNVLNETGDGRWHTQLWDATGDGAGDPAVLDDEAGWHAQDTDDVDGDGLSELLTRSSGDASPKLAAFDADNGTIEQRWTLNRDAHFTGQAQDVDDDGRREAYVWTHDPRELRLIHDEGTEANPPVTMDPDRRYNEPAAQHVQAVGQDHEAVAEGDAVVAQNDGRIVWLDAELGPTGEEVEAANRATPFVAGALADGDPARVVAINSQQETEAIFPEASEPRGDPGIDWTNTNPGRHILDPGPGDRRVITVNHDADPAGPQISALDPTGAAVWETRLGPLGASGRVSITYTVLGDFDGDGGEDVFLTGHDRVSANHGVALDGATGEVLCTTGPVEDAPRWPLAHAFRMPGAHDYTGDGIDDIVVGNNRADQRLEFRDGATCELLSTQGASWINSVSLPNTDDDALPEASVSRASPGVPGLLDISEQEITFEWENRDNRGRLPLVLDVDGDGTEDLVFGDGRTSGRIFALDGATGSLAWSKAVAGGQVYENVSEADQAGALRFAARSMAGTTGFPGADGAALLAPGNDGHVYALEADGTPLWEGKGFPIGFPVSHPAMVDLDEDGKVELVVSAGDGNLYALDHDPDGPTIEITRPVDRHVYLNDTDLVTVPEPVPTLPPVAVGPVNVTIEAHDQTSGIDRVEIYVDGDLRETIDGPEVGTGGEFEWRWEPSWNETGLHNVTAVAYDRALFAHDTTTSQQVIAVSTDVDGLIRDVNATITRLLDDPRGFVNDTLDQLPDDAPTASTVPAPGLALPGGAAPDVALTVPAMPRASTPAGPGDRGHLATPP